MEYKRVEYDQAFALPSLNKYITFKAFIKDTSILARTGKWV